MLNKAVVMGRLTRNPELKHTQSGTAVVSFSLAVDRDFKDKQTGEKGVDFLDVTAWHQTAEFVSRFLSKGRLAVVEGRLQVRTWTANDGTKRKAVEIVAENVYFADSRRDSSGEGTDVPYEMSPQAASALASPPAFQALPEDDGELPF